MKQPWSDDDALMADLAEALHDVRPLVERVARFGRGAYAWRNVDQDLLRASLSFDSLLEPTASDRSGEGDPRVLVFTAAPLSVELEVQPDHVIGQIVPAGSGRIVVEDAEGESMVIQTDDLGFFVLLGLPRRPIRLRCETENGKLVTDWVRL